MTTDDWLALTPQQVAERVTEEIVGRYPDVQPRDLFELALLHATLDVATELCRPERTAREDLP